MMNDENAKTPVDGDLPEFLKHEVEKHKAREGQAPAEKKD